MPDGLTIEASVDFRSPTRRKPAESHASGAEGAEDQPAPRGRVPRISRIMALAIRLDGLIRDGVVTDYADVARLGHVSRARVTQIMNLLHLAPDIQEALLLLPEVSDGRDPIRERMVRPIAAVMDWRKQRKIWQKMRTSATS